MRRLLTFVAAITIAGGVAAPPSCATPGHGHAYGHTGKHATSTTSTDPGYSANPSADWWV